MKVYLVTGGAGFIGANYLKYLLAKYDDIRVVVLDLLTYAGYMGPLPKTLTTNAVSLCAATSATAPSWTDCLPNTNSIWW